MSTTIAKAEAITAQKFQPSDRIAQTDDAIPVEAVALSPGLNRLEQLEEEISAGIEAVNMGLRQMQQAAFEIKEDGLWQEAGYQSYTDYAQHRWGWGKSQAYAVATAGKTVQHLLDSGVPENEIPEATSALEEIAKAPEDQQVDVLQETAEREGNITAAAVRKTLKHTPSLELMIALWSQVGKVERPAIATQPEKMVVSTPLLAQPLVFESVRDAQQYWQVDGRRLCEMAVNAVEPNAEAKAGLCMVPVEIMHSARAEETGQRAMLMGGWSEDAEDSRGQHPTPWVYAFQLSGSCYLRALHLHQVKVLWEDTSAWKPSHRAPAERITEEKASSPAMNVEADSTAVAETESQPSEARPRHENDFYETPSRLTQGLLEFVDISGSILECCAGDRAIAQALKSYRNTITENDITSPLYLNGDATSNEFWQGVDRYDWVVTNPPFNAAPSILPLAYDNCRKGMAMLLRLSYFEPCDNRHQWMLDNLDQMRFLITVNPRPQFRQDTRGTDSATVAWFVWEKGFSWADLGIVEPPFGFIKDWR